MAASTTHPAPLALQGKHIVLGLSGGVACYKAAELTRELVKAGATVQVVMTDAATQFITPVSMQALSGRPVYTSQWDAREANHMPHINLTREADAIVVAPASADFIAQLAQGRAGELLSLLCLARPIERCPLLVAPAMNREMCRTRPRSATWRKSRPTAPPCWARLPVTRPAAKSATAACWKPTNCATS